MYRAMSNEMLQVHEEGEGNRVAGDLAAGVAGHVHFRNGELGIQ